MTLGGKLKIPRKRERKTKGFNFFSEMRKYFYSINKKIARGTTDPRHWVF